jgi:DNA polymerase-3 subunit delta
MTAIKAADADRFAAKPDPAQPIVLVYGPDAGLVRERVEAVIRASVDDANDPFALARIDSEELSANPGRLADEANTVPLFGGRRAVLLRVNSRHNIIPSVEAVLAAPPRDCRVVIEAGELRKNAPLRTLCEKAKAAAAIACYADNERDIARVIDEEMREANLTLSGEARTALAGLLGGDRLASRSEVRKLALYAAGKNRVELDDVLAVVSDASALSLDGVVDAAFAGRAAEVETEFNKARGEGLAPGTIVSAALRQVAQLHRMRLAIADGDDVESAMMRGGPPVHFSRRARVGAALNSWTPARLLRAMGQLAEASLETRRQPALAEAIAQRTLLSLAVSARRKD